MIIYKTLEHVNDQVIYDAFIEAFIDYDVPMKPSLLSFEAMLKRRGFDKSRSYGAFDHDKLVGFILNGYGMWEDKETLYDLGTGVILDYRRQGITTSLFKEVLLMMKEQNIRHYLLEVLKTNDKAIQLYKGEGFEITRTLNCYKISKDDLPSISSNLTINDVKDESVLSLFKTMKPSWQNSYDSLLRSWDDLNMVTLSDHMNIIAYGIISKHSGDVAQCIFKEGYATEKNLNILLYELSLRSNSDYLTLLNVDEKYTFYNEALKEIGFTHYIGQYEMILNLETL